MYRLSTTNDLVIRMECGNATQWNVSGTMRRACRRDGALKKFGKSAKGSRTERLEPNGAAPIVTGDLK